MYVCNSAVILEMESVEQRKMVLTCFIDVASKLMEMNNFFGAMEVRAASCVLLSL